MIKINLARASKGRVQDGTEDLGVTGTNVEGGTPDDDGRYKKQGLVRIFLILLAPVLLFVYEQQTVPVRQAELQTRRALLDELNKKNEKAAGAVLEIKKFKVDQAKLQGQIDVLENLKKARMQEVKVLESIQRIIPGRLWLTKMEIGDGKVNLYGLTSTDQGLTSFMDSLSRSIFLKDVSLVKSQEASDDQSGMSLKTFEINCQLERVQ